MTEAPQWKHSLEHAPLRSIRLAEDLEIGGSSNNTLVMAGPCSVESREQIRQVAEMLVRNGVRVMRAGCFKPRTSPYNFMGLGLEGLELLAEVRRDFGLKIITEVRDSTQVDAVIEHADIIQIGAKAMWDYGILGAVGRIDKPVMVKRAFGATLQELARVAEFILAGGNENVLVCERGIRSFEPDTRFTLDLCGVAWLKQHTNLPIVLDPSHAMGYRYGVPDLSRACVAMGIDGLLIETHPCPDQAKSDASQQLDFETFEAMYRSLQPIAEAINHNLV
ncbi:MAG: 3-deoxy-7-phosphoheptulonate synthase [Myxococcota bacterium]|nr:3-deoxy-7-phosphoheptulonate synthase [Myxococcota bacterium]